MGDNDTTCEYETPDGTVKSKFLEQKVVARLRDDGTERKSEMQTTGAQRDQLTLGTSAAEETVYVVSIT